MPKPYINLLFIAFLAGMPGFAVLAESSADVAVPLQEVETPLPEPDRHSARRLPDMELRQTVDRYRERIVELEAGNGAYDPALQEELFGLGQAMLNLGEYDEAIELFTRAMHINRVSEGLYNLEQLDYLKHIIEANRHRYDLEALTDNYEYLVWISEHNYPENDVRRVPAYLQAADGYLHTSALAETQKQTIRQLNQASDMFEQAVDTIATAKGRDDPEMIDALYGIVQAHYQLVEPFGFLSDYASDLKSRYFASQTEMSSSTMARLGIPSGVRNEIERRSIPVYSGTREDDQLASLLINSYREGREALLRIVGIHEQHPQLPDKAYVKALVDTGDWYLRFSKRNHAESFYQRAWQQMQDSGYDEEAIGSLFGRPRPLGRVEQEPAFEFERIQIVSTQEVPLPDTTITPEPAAPDPQTRPDGKYVVAEFTVTRQGTVKNVKIIEANPEDSHRFQMMARTLIRTTPFRPRLQDGKLVSTEDVRMIYRFE